MTDPKSMIEMTSMKDLLALQQSAYRDATSLLFDSLHKIIENQNNTIFELRKSLEYSQQDIIDIKKELLECKKQISDNSTKMNENHQLSKSLQIKQAKMEDHSRKNNIRIEGIDEAKQENWEQTLVKVQQLIDNKLELENIKVDFAHRINRKQNKSGPRPIIARFAHDSDKEKTLKNSWKLKGSQVFINEDLSEFTLQKRKEQMTDMINARKAGKIAYFNKEKLIIKERKQVTPEPINSSASSQSVASLVHQFTPKSSLSTNMKTSNNVASSDTDFVSPKLLENNKNKSRGKKSSTSK